MKIVVFGLTISSSWGNGHATLWRGLCRALARRGHHVVFFEQNRPYYETHRDLNALADGNRLEFYERWEEVRSAATRELADADAAVITSYCGDAVAATELVAAISGLCRVFYDLDTPVTLQAVEAGEPVPYLGPRGLADFDLVLSYTGGRALDELSLLLGARRVAPLYGSVDAEVHRPAAPEARFRADLSYLGTYAEDRQRVLEELLVEPARRRPDRRFLIGGAQYPASFPWTANISFVHHLEPAQHPAFFCSSPLTLNVTRQAMKSRGYCPSGRLFEAAACGAAILSDLWEGLESFFTPGEEILVANTCEGAIEALDLPPDVLQRIGAAARERTLAEHTAMHRARELEDLLGRTSRGKERDTALAAAGTR